MINETFWTKFPVRFISLVVALNGLLLVYSTLIGQFGIRHFHINSGRVELNLIIGLALIVLANLLWRRKQNAWFVTFVAYGFFVGATTGLHLANISHPRELGRVYLLPVIALVGLIIFRHLFRVKSDIRSFAVSLRLGFLILLVAFVYGVSGFLLMDKTDFHHEISLYEAIHRTIDQFGLTTNTQLHPYTERARVFLDSLNIFSIVSVSYVLLSLFQPLRARFGDQSQNRLITRDILLEYPADSEDFFKLWPHDKGYFINESHTAGIAFRVHRGVALAVGDPYGNPKKFKSLISDFTDLCLINDWTPSFIHISPKYQKIYINNGYSVQKIGEEAVVDISEFVSQTVNNKYFRNIKNRFEKNGYSVEVLQPPHSDALMNRLKEVSDDWLQFPGRTERGFMMGFYDPSYIQASTLLVLRDSALTIQAFINQIPSYDNEEANYDLLRQTINAQTNSVDYLLMQFIKYADEKGFKRVNLGLSPLVGIDKEQENYSMIDRTMKFVFANTDKIYSFNGLYNFKKKYEPTWLNRYIAYKGGLRAFSKTLNSLNSSMKPHYQGKKLESEELPR